MNLDNNIDFISLCFICLSINLCTATGEDVRILNAMCGNNSVKYAWVAFFNVEVDIIIKCFNVTNVSQSPVICFRCQHFQLELHICLHSSSVKYDQLLRVLSLELTIPICSMNQR